MTERQSPKDLPAQGTWTRLVQGEGNTAAGAPDSGAVGKLKIRTWKPGEEILGTYAVEQVISGGMGHVYIAYHKKWRRKVAIKSPNEKMLAHKKLFARILREANAWVEMGLHPHIAYCYFVRNIAGIPHIFVEYVDGGNLRAWLKRRPAGDFRDALNLAIQFCHGMEFAHGRGMIHRDIKPENILLTAEGILKITDFGIARTRGPEGDDAGAHPDIEAADLLLTRVGASMGTPDYMSPEQSANAHDVDERADIFSFGVCLYEMFCGVRPKLLETGVPPDPVAIAKGAAVPEALACAILKCVAMNREDRYKGFDALRDDLIHAFTERYHAESPFAGMEALAPEADGLSNKGVSLLELERFEEARACFEKALALDSLHPQANWNLGRFHVLNETFFHPAHQDQAVDMVRQILKEGGLSDEEVEVRIRRSLEENTFFRAIALDLEGHRDRVNAAAVSACGRYAASAGSDGKVMLWELRRGRRLRVLDGHEQSVNDLCFSPGGAWLATGGSDQTVRIWHPETGEALRMLTGHVMRVSCVAVSPDGRRIASAGDDRTIRIWDAATGEPLMTLTGHGSAVNALAFLIDGEWLASAGDGRRIRLWRMADGRCDAIMECPAEGLFALAVSADGRVLAAGGRDRDIHLFRTDTGARVKSLTGHKHWVNTLAFSPDGQFIVSGSGDHTLRVWDGRTGHHLKTLEGHRREVSDAAFSPDGRHLVSAGWDHLLKVWHVNVLQPQLTSPLDYSALQRRRGARKRRLVEIEKDIARSHFSKAYRAVLKQWSRDGYGRLSPFYPVFERLRAMGALTGVHAVTPFLRLQAGSHPVHAVRFSPDGRWVAAGGEDRQVVFWDVASGEALKRFMDFPEPVNALSWSPDGRYLAAAADSVTLYDPQSGETVWVLAHPKRVNALTFSPDGRFLITGCDDHRVRMWDAATGGLVRTLEGHGREIQSAAVSGDGRFVAVCNGPEIQIRDISTGALRHTFGGHRLFGTAMAFSKTGVLLAAVTRGNEILLRDADTGDTRRTLGGAVSEITCLTFSPSGRYLIAGTAGQTLEIWSVATGEPLKSLSGHRGAVQCVDISLNGRFIASGSLDNTVRIWLIVPDLEFSGDLMPVAFSEKQLVAHLDALIDREKFREAFQQLQEAWIREEFTDKKAAYRIFNRLKDAGRHVGGYFAVLVAALKGHTSYVRSVAFSPDGRTLASGSWDTTVRLWDMTRGVGAGVLKGHGTHVESVAFSPDGRFLASGGSDGLVIFWDVTTGSAIRTFSAHAARVRSLVFLRGGKVMVSAGDDNAIRFWDSESGRDIKTLRGDNVQVNAMAFSPEGGAFAVASDDGRVRFIRLKGERQSRRFKGNTRRVNDVAFSADGRSLASAGDDRTVRVWDIASGRVTHVFKDHAAEARAVAFSPDGAFLVSGGEDTLVKLWHLPSGTLLQTLEGHLKGITSVGFSNDGQIAASASEDNTIRLWLVMPNLAFDP